MCAYADELELSMRNAEEVKLQTGLENDWGRAHAKLQGLLKREIEAHRSICKTCQAEQASK